MLYRESGSSWWPLLWGPAFAVAGYLIELITGPASVALWTAVGLGLTLGAVLWVYGRIKTGSVALTAEEAQFGRERLPVSMIEACRDVGAPAGARVLGGGWSVPKGTTAVPLRLLDGTVVLAWARDPEALLAALRRVVRG
ncbi:DUF3093 family protein [Lentzea flava]|uniref:DUF3093 domain-containing protein n=1 Tax=Lentzea flava TaxID=103732 RepID=A0ABQ2UFL6_9PSEU|nr:DUF3093 family protein [Lentzea flava]MCP2198759.1 Protein of unknown function (DUF3093) [Lentzea flava]GGU29840.1 hypothetical protein GCM10010178_22690 [Lentzea flava]